MSRRREIHEEKKEEKRRLREEQRVRGVDLEGAKLTELPVMRNFSEGVPEGTVLGPEDAPEEFREMHGRQENLQDEPRLMMIGPMFRQREKIWHRIPDRE